MSVANKFVNIAKVRIVRDIPVKNKVTGEVLYYDEKYITVKEDTETGDELEVSVCYRCGTFFLTSHEKEHREMHKREDEIESLLKL